MVDESHDAFGLMLNLILGPHLGDGQWTEPQLRRGWWVYRQQLMTPKREPRPGERPWGFWKFDLGEEPPEGDHAQVVRLAELGELSPQETAEIRERGLAAKRRLETERNIHIGEHQRMVAMWQAVERAGRR